MNGRRRWFSGIVAVTIIVLMAPVILVGYEQPAFAACGDRPSYDAEVTKNGNTWTARNGSRTTVYSGGDMAAAVQAAINSLTSGRASKEWVLVRGDGSISADSRISLPSYTGIDVCGTINVTGSASGDYAPIYARGVRDIEVRYLNVTGSPSYGIFMRNVENVVLGDIQIRVSSGLGVRIDNHGNRSERSRNIQIDQVYVSGTSTHGVETYGVDGLSINRVTVRDTGGSGLLLNDTINATVNRIDADGAGTGTGYAALRFANRNGRVGDSYPTNIRIGSVKAVGGGRGIFCVSESGGVVIDQVDIQRTGNNSILIENCYNMTIADQSGTVNGGGEIRLAARDEFPPSRDITLQNLTVRNTDIRWSPCVGDNIVTRNITRENSNLYWCSAPR
ncbi:right-handed parallel beta-helix repeat-containing protein [Paludifilum halophilum]|nr:right-handed parallel beta-helix repeat-containing protein [Paludifilum halophilum]